MNATARAIKAGLVLILTAACATAQSRGPSAEIPTTTGEATPIVMTAAPTTIPTTNPTVQPTTQPATTVPSAPTLTLEPTSQPTALPSALPTALATPEPTPDLPGLVIDWRERPGDHGFGLLFDDSETSTLHTGAVFANRYFIAGDLDDGDYNAIGTVWSSADGLTWEIALTGLGDIYSMAANDAGLLVVAESSARTDLRLTTNGTDWETIAVSDDPNEYVYQVGATPAGFVAFGSGSWTSIDGVNWVSMATESAGDLAALGVQEIVSYGERLVALTGGHGGGAIVAWTSANLADWTMAGPLAGTRNVHETILAGGPLGWIVTGVAENGLRTSDLMFASPDGLTWQRVTPPIGPISDVFVDEAGFVAVGFLYIPNGCDADPSEIQGLTWTSTDGRSWSAMPSAEFQHKRIDHLFRDGRTLVGIGLGYEENSGSAFGVVWTTRLPSIAPAGPGPTAAPTPAPGPGGCGPR